MTIMTVCDTEGGLHEVAISCAEHVEVLPEKITVLWKDYVHDSVTGRKRETRIFGAYVKVDFV